MSLIPNESVGSSVKERDINDNVHLMEASSQASVKRVLDGLSRLWTSIGNDSAKVQKDMDMWEGADEAIGLSGGREYFIELPVMFILKIDQS